MKKHLTPKQLRELRATRVGDVGNRLEKASELLDVRQKDIVDATDLTTQYVNDVFRGRYTTITLTNAYKFARFFGCQVEDLWPPVLEAVA